MHNLRASQLTKALLLDPVARAWIDLEALVLNLSHLRMLRYPASAVWNKDRFHAFARPREFQGALIFGKRNLFSNDLVDLHPPPLEVSKRPTEAIDLCKGALDTDLAPKQVKRTELREGLFWVDTVNKEGAATADVPESLLANRGSSCGLDDVVETVRAQFLKALTVHLGILSIHRDHVIRSQP